MPSQRILVTGASGCIGHYISEALIQDTEHELFLLVRQPAKLKVDVQARPGIHVLEGNMHTIERYSDLLPTLHSAVLTATVWGGDDIYKVNVEQTHRLIQQLNPEVCQQVLYFSTASVLDRQLNLIPEAGTLGTDYIRSKYLCLQELAQSPLADRIVALFPTLVFGGDAQKPYSQISAGLPQILDWLWLARFLKTDASFHFVHGRDIALVVLHLLNHPPAYGGQKLVLGNSEVTINQCVEALCNYANQPIYFRINLTLGLANLIIKLFKIQMAEWDYFCLNQRYFGYDRPVNPAAFGLDPYCSTLPDLLKITCGDRA
ncbi:MAG: NAD(P)-dependent oxidoreductase [Aphanocapsa sp. GSE-SYN-MK-11-07L]|jgi:nucleoside-diphosphate-sugar epimerase|nr:NAD(P)-dependent oxidoreductase [Aphanocapsa sp. GSE-SYN-MK-11-07L]